MFRLISVHRAHSVWRTLHEASGSNAFRSGHIGIVYKRAIHASIPTLGGRRSGGSAFVAEPRDFSKKQKQRWRKDHDRKLAIKEASKNPSLDEKLIEKQYGGEEMKKFIADTRTAMADVVRDLMLPQSQSVLLNSNADGQVIQGLPGMKRKERDPSLPLYDENWRNEYETEREQGHSIRGFSAYESLVEQILQVEPARVMEALRTGKGGDISKDSASKFAANSAVDKSPTLQQKTPSAQARSLLHPATLATATIRLITDGKPTEAKELLIEARRHQRDVDMTGATGPHVALIKSSTKPAQHYLETLLQGFCVEKLRDLAFKNQQAHMMKLFNDILAADIEPDTDMWEWLVYAQSRTVYVDTQKNASESLVPIMRPDGKFTNKPVYQGLALKRDPTSAIATIDRLKAIGAPVTIGMFNAVLYTLVNEGHKEEALNWWLRMHREPGIKLNEDSFIHMIKHATLSRNAEKAFWYLDEMRSSLVDVTPTLRTYNKLLRACAEAPQWVRGYEDTIFDAMALMEGAEIEPNILSYQNIMYALGRGGDSRGAEYYFWEMRSKGLKPSLTCYNVLFEAYGRAQAVGASEHGYPGRYAPKADRLHLRPHGMTEDEKAHLELGAKQVSKLISQGLHYDADGDDKNNARGGKYNRGGKLQDMLDDEETSDAMREQLKIEAQEVVAKYGSVRDQLIKEGELPAPPGYVPPPALQAGTQSLKSRKSMKSMISEIAEEEEEYTGEEGETLAQMASKDAELADLLKEMGLSDSQINLNQDSMSLLERLEREEAREQANLDTMLKDSGRKNYVPKDGEEMDYAEFEEMEEADPAENEEAVRDREAWEVERMRWKNWEDPYPTERSAYKREQRKLKRASDAEQGKERRSIFNFINEANSKEGGANGLHNALSLLDGSAPKGLFAGADGSYRAADEYIDDQWDRIEFGRAPPPNYLYNTPARQIRQFENRVRAKLAFDELTAWMGVPPLLLTHEVKEMQYSAEELPPGAEIPDAVARPYPWRDSMPTHSVVAPPKPQDGQMLPTSDTMNALLSVYAECLRDQDAIAVFKAFPKYGVRTTQKTYHILLRMYIRRKDIDSALTLKEDMQSRVLGQVINPDAKTFGLLIDTLTHRSELPRALNLLEEATALGLRINEKHLRMLRKRCEGLNVKHPNLPASPTEWVDKIKHSKRTSIDKSQRRIQPLRSLLYTK